jgi:hypothetical protein
MNCTFGLAILCFRGRCYGGNSLLGFERTEATRLAELFGGQLPAKAVH